MGSRRLVFAMTGCQALAGGIASANGHVLRILSALAEERAHRLTVLSYLERDCDRPGWLASHVHFVGLQGRKLAFAGALWAEIELGSLFCFDHVALARPLLPFAGVRLARTVILAHGSEAWKRLRRSSRRSFRMACLCLANSEFTARKMREQMPDARITACPLGLSPEFPLNDTIPPGLDGDLTLEAADGTIRPVGTRFLLLVSRLHPQECEKGHRELIALLPRWLSEFPDLKLVFPGPGEDRLALRSLACERGVGGAVYLPGWLPAEDLGRLYAGCTAFVMPSRQEGFGLAYLEAMNFGKPCVGCAGQGAEDVIVDGETGYLVRDSHYLEGLDAVVRRLLREPEVAQRLGQNGFRRLHQRFTARHYQQRLEAQFVPLL